MSKDTAMDHFTENASDRIVNARMSPEASERSRLVIGALVRHLHAFVKEIALTQAEWEIAIDFLTRTGQTCTDTRQEFILLSDVLGVSMLVDAVCNRKPDGATPSTVFGPFHVDGVPERPMGASISLDGKGEACLYQGRVLDLAGQPVTDALVDVWSDNADGFYDVQQPDLQPKHNNRGVFRTGADGRYAFVGIRPVAYPIPDDGTVGQLLAHLGRHPWRPAHMHFLISAPGCQRLVTHTFVSGDPWLASDAVFGVKAPLIAEYRRNPAPDGPPWLAEYDFVLPPQAD